MLRLHQKSEFYHLHLHKQHTPFALQLYEATIHSSPNHSLSVFCPRFRPENILDFPLPLDVYKRQVLAYGEAWVNVIGCEFDGNRTGLHYNTRDTSPSDSSFTDNQFKDNETAVLLESVSVELEMNFSGCQFEHNGTDIDNRCGQPLKLS